MKKISEMYEEMKQKAGPVTWNYASHKGEDTLEEDGVIAEFMKLLQEKLELYSGCIKGLGCLWVFYDEDSQEDCEQGDYVFEVDFEFNFYPDDEAAYILKELMVPNIVFQFTAEKDIYMFLSHGGTKRLIDGSAQSTAIFYQRLCSLSIEEAERDSFEIIY